MGARRGAGQPLARRLFLWALGLSTLPVLAWLGISGWLALTGPSDAFSRDLRDRLDAGAVPVEAVLAPGWTRLCLVAHDRDAREAADGACSGHTRDLSTNDHYGALVVTRGQSCEITPLRLLHLVPADPGQIRCFAPEEAQRFDLGPLRYPFTRLTVHPADDPA
ncbi:MAG: hypothetical protein AAFQ51_03955 [Pseudomonadota bacterium]